ncbi:cupin domain-containing protein [Shouchella lehensis]|uniref:Cupin domain-containing protein n=1 Tax=Shouchella lehensis TaxID=300825 RepID=A0A4Y7WKH6_9BACI|nr:cupin domain-containing protein [Shouchella lehensis]MBG9783441.1 cupin [Shouchella lehensis]RQW22342.1 cupin domain-containing protein [Bacillus sp. C1-1]TES49166.1 cupin domain-containing protein [Shouchella lehensis]
MKSEIINIKNLTDKIEKRYENFILSKVNDHCVRVAVFEGTYEWHFHPDSEESFLVLEGELIIEVEDLSKPIVLQPNDFYTVPAGVTHRTLSKCRTVNLCFEKTETITTFIKEK